MSEAAEVSNEQLVADLSGKVADLEKKLKEMTDDRNAFRAEKLSLEKKLAAVPPAAKAAVLPGTAVRINGVEKQIVQVLDAAAVVESIKKNNDDSRSSTFVQVR